MTRYDTPQSVLGGFLDPLADKVLVACLSVPLAMQGREGRVGRVSIDFGSLVRFASSTPEQPRIVDEEPD